MRKAAIEAHLKAIAEQEAAELEQTGLVAEEAAETAPDHGGPIDIPDDSSNSSSDSSSDA